MLKFRMPLNQMKKPQVVEMKAYKERYLKKGRGCTATAKIVAPTTLLSLLLR